MLQTSLSISSPKARLIAFYLPQFHPIPENDQWWGKGFTEWTNVAKAKPLFFGHEQPQVPADLGFYDLRVAEVREAQAEMAKEYGIEGFCYWHYWFGNGKRLLEKPFQEVLRLKQPNFPFCLAWVNQTWSGIWHGSPDKVLIKQYYPGKEDYREHFYTLLDAFSDERYLTIEGKPIFMVYEPTAIPDSRFFTDYWQELAIQSGLKGLYFIGITQDPAWNPINAGFHASVVSNPNYLFTVPHAIIYKKLNIYQRLYKKILSIIAPKKCQEYFPPMPKLYSYEKAIQDAFIKNDFTFDNYPCVFPNWDNTPRSGLNGRVFVGSTPDLFKIHLRTALEQVTNRYSESEKRIIIIKSWNEWAEGNYLEPDLKFGKAYLEAIKQEIIEDQVIKKNDII
ncbi:lipopolysaccharide biosynthesis protein [Aphanothece hegewaldii CCALA 016]|uniref:Lipopolysaccharide biosynthesis protein n=1 Tax=Aphanothece hegewaldii CCALA 016 TaxID=2107694 RepID=A0A2T1M420_9CHRO|nr:glycoside hydrolase family 99-like domain-containing protein [Aphanothece hegewaldii]PSF39562.1 lipopolysaccharide biosynthesis protein [Aphanothece hegewaldii CCALA 016]